MYSRKFFSLVLILKLFTIFGNVLSEDQSEVDFSRTPKVDNDTITSDLEESLKAHYRTILSLPFYGANGNVAYHGGYNYKPPSSRSTFAVPSAVNSAALRFRSANNPNFVSRENIQKTTTDTSAQSNFHAPHNPINPGNVQYQHSKAESVNESIVESQNMQVTKNEGQRSPNYSSENWRPLLTHQSNPNTFSGEPSNVDQINRESINNLKNNQTNFQQELPIPCEKNLWNSKEFETEPRSFMHFQGDVPSYNSKSLPDAPLPNFFRPNGKQFSAPTSINSNSLNSRRLNLLKSLLAEYLALTQVSQSPVPNAQQPAQADLEYNEIAENSPNNRFSTAAKILQYPAYSSVGLSSPAENEFSAAFHLQRQQNYQEPPTIPTARQPHLVYGVPYFQ